MQIRRWYHKNLKFSENRNLFDNNISDMFTVSVKMRTQDTWFLLCISVIQAQLRLVGVSVLLDWNWIPQYIECESKASNTGLLMTILVFQFLKF